MTKKVMRFLEALECRTPDRVPFVPAIYEHKGWFIGRTPSAIARDADLLTEAILAEYECVRADALVVGVDVYNVEAEAVGSKVTFFDDTGIPAVAEAEAILKEDMPVKELSVPDPYKDARMPLFVESARRVAKKLGDVVPIRGAVSGPFSLAANLAGPLNLFTMTLSNPQRVHDILRFSVRVAYEYGRALIEAGCGVVVFDSQASPDLLSPAMYKEFVLGPTRELISRFRELGVHHVPLIIGGNTTGILGEYLETGANNILCDFPADASRFLAECSARKVAFRRNINSTEFLTTRPEEVRKEALRAISEADGYPGFILGTGVVPYGTPLDCLLAAREAVERTTNHEP